MKVSLEDILALENEIAMISIEQSRLAAKAMSLSVKVVEMLKDNDIELFDTGEPTSAYVNQDR